MNEEDIPTKSSVELEISALFIKDVEELLCEAIADIKANKANKRLGGGVPIDRYPANVISMVQVRLTKRGWSTEVETRQREKYLVIS